MIAPDKNRIYGEYYPDYINKINPDSKNRTNKLLKYLMAKTCIKIIYPYSTLMGLKSIGYLYYKADTHWNSFGAYIAFRELMNEIKKDIPVANAEYELRENTSSEVPLTDLAKALNVKKSDDAVYKFPQVMKQYSVLKYDRTPRSDDIFYNHLNKFDIVLFRDSFSNALKPFVCNTFRKSSFFWIRQMNVQDLDYIRNNSDVFVLEVVERQVPDLIKMRFPEKL